MGGEQTRPYVPEPDDEEHVQPRYTERKSDTSSPGVSHPGEEHYERYRGLLPTYGIPGETAASGETREFKRTGRTRGLHMARSSREEMAKDKDEESGRPRAWEAGSSSWGPDIESRLPRSRYVKPSEPEMTIIERPKKERVEQPPQPSSKRETHRERLDRERKTIEGQIEDTKMQLSRRIRALEHRIKSLMRLSPMEKHKIDRRLATVGRHFSEGLAKVNQDRNETFSRLLESIEEIEMQQSASSRMDWEPLDDLIVRMTMFYSELLTELRYLEERIHFSETPVQLKAQGATESITTRLEALSLPRFQAKAHEGTSSPTGPSETFITIDERGGVYDISNNGLALQILPNTVTQQTKIKCTKRSTDFLPSPAENMETTVSYIVGLGPQNVHLQRPIITTLIHSGPGRGYGYKTIVKAFNSEQLVWEELEESESGDSKKGTKDCIQVKITKLTILAVVSRLVKDRFVVTSKGCVVKSSVCDDIILQFPEGAVNRYVNGSLQVLMMPKNLTTSGYPCPILFVDGFEDINFLKYVVVRIPHPCPAKYPVGQIHLMCLKQDQWMVITDQTDRVVCVEQQSYVELHVEHFSWLWAWLHAVPSNLEKLYRYLRHSPRAVCIAAFKENKQLGFTPKITLLCAANHDEKGIQKMRDDNYVRLARTTSRKDMRPNDKAYLRLEGNYETDPGCFLRFLMDDSYIEELRLSRTRERNPTEDSVILRFYSNKEEPAEDDLVCNLFLNEDNNLKEKLWKISAEEAAQQWPTLLDMKRTSQQDTPEHVKFKAQDEYAGHHGNDFVRSTIIDQIPPDCLPSQTDRVYKMTSSPRGLAVIFNVRTFNIPPEDPNNGKLEERFGSENDVEKLRLLFEGLDFYVKYIPGDTSADDLMMILHTISSDYDLTAYDCFVCCIMSHGKADSIYTSDGKLVPSSAITALFMGFEGLVGKPKLFFFQGCRGHKKDKGMIRPDGPGVEISEATNYPLQSSSRSIPMTRDILNFYSCYKGYQSYRDSVNGSPFIQHLVDVFRKYACCEDILCLIMRIKREVGDEGEQMPQSEDSLIKKLFFWPGVRF